MENITHFNYFWFRSLYKQFVLHINIISNDFFTSQTKLWINNSILRIRWIFHHEWFRSKLKKYLCFKRLNRKIIGDWFLKTIQMENKSVNEFKCDNAFIPQTVILYEIFWTCKKRNKVTWKTMILTTNRVRLEINV